MKWRSVARWTARVLSLLLVAFFLLFSFDEPVLSLGFVMHNLPTAVVGLAAAAA